MVAIQAQHLSKFIKDGIVYKSVELLRNNLFIPLPKDVYALLELNHRFVRIVENNKE